MGNGHIYILEFGSQTTDLIGKRLEEISVPVKYAPSDVRLEDLGDAAGVIISGGPKSVKNPDAYPFDPRIFTDFQRPVLGICYGHQLGAAQFGGSIHNNTKEYGHSDMEILSNDPLLAGHDRIETIWNNHGDSISRDGDYEVKALTEKGVPAFIRRGNFASVQYHPEVSHTPKGRKLLSNYAKQCGFEPHQVGFDAGKFIDEEVRRLRDEVGDKMLLAYFSGGVDSSTAVALANMADLKVWPVYIETGFGRNNEAAFAVEKCRQILRRKLRVHDITDTVLKKMKDLNDSEGKRKEFQRIYNETRNELERYFDLTNTILFDGSIETDYRESGQDTRTQNGATVNTIKTHHNSSGWKGRKVSPLAGLTKERTRMVARTLELPLEISERRPFPGPGLSVRLLTGVFEVPEELQRDVYEAAADYDLNAVVVPRKSVGLKGDERALEHIVIVSGERDWQNVRKASKYLIEEFPICRVIYTPDRVDPNHSNLVQPRSMNKRNLDRLRDVTEVVETTMDDYDIAASQVPVAAFSGPYGWINVIRDVESEDFRTCRPLEKPDEFPWQAYDEIKAGLKRRLGTEAGLTGFDASDKPGGTTELE